MSNLYNPDYLKHLCQKYNLRPSKQYGQNYLVDPTVIEKIIAASDLSADDTVVEVGPGFGTLTLALAEKAGRVVAFEIEKKLMPYWDRVRQCHPEQSEGSLSCAKRDSSVATLAQNDSKIEIVWGNILKEFLTVIPNPRRRGEESSLLVSEPDFSHSFEMTIWRGSLGMTGDYKVIANLPYQITSPVIRLFLETDQPPELMVLMVQKEVAERICAEPGDMSLLSVAVQYYAEPELLFVVPRDSFWPAPRVDSAVIKITPKKLSRLDKKVEQFFFQIVKAGFAARRKLLIKNLVPVIGKKNRGQLEAVFAELNLNKNVRAQELSVSEWGELVKFIYPLTR